MVERIPKIILFILLVFVATSSYSQIDEVRVIDNKGTIANVPISPIKAIGKIAVNGSVIKATNGISAERISTGRYKITIDASIINISDADFIIQLTQPGRGGAGNDDPGISYSNQLYSTTPTATASFEVIIGDNDNGGTDRNRFDSEFMFVILDL